MTSQPQDRDGAQKSGTSEPHRLPGSAPDGEPASLRPSPLRWLLLALPVVVFLLGVSLLARVLSTNPPETAGQGAARMPAPQVTEEDRESRVPTFPFAPIDLGSPDSRDGAPEQGQPEGAARQDEAQAEAFSVAEVVRRLAKADPAEGAKSARMCAPCHPLGKDEWHKVGPSLWGVVGRAKASAPGFSYSQAMRTRGGSWTAEDLAAFLNNPRATVPGTSMAFMGISEAKRVAEVIAYLRTLADAPTALP